MEVFFHFSVAGFSNCYLIGPEGGGEAIIVDPGVINVPLIRAIEDNHFQICGVLLTHTHGSHVKGLKTLLKIYDAQVYANNDEVMGFPCVRVSDDLPFSIAGVGVHPIVTAGHSVDSVVYLIGYFLFTGDVLGPGRVGTAPNAFARALLSDSIRERICTLPKQTIIFPGHGAPTTVEVESRLNPLLTASE